jgi:2-desacetyl-2-hydroxyethyl bacteriochlorophyllide A dehydrogenase
MHSNRVVTFTGPKSVEVRDEPSLTLGKNDVRVRTLFSGISAGTELTAYRGTNPYLDKRWNDARKLFEFGEASQHYPIVGWGYEEVGRVIETGRGAEGVAPGDLVWGTWGHRTETVVSDTYARARILAADVDPRIGMFSQIGGIAMNVALDGDIHVGETVVVFGLGVPGQLVAQLARLNGARVIVVDGVASRRDLALRLGADLALDPADGEVAEQVRDLTDGRGADVCLEVTGNYRALHEAIRTVAYSSRVCAAGFMQGDGIGLRLGEEFHHNRVQVVSTQISGVAPALQHRWDRMRLDSTAIALASSGRLRVTELISHTYALEEAPAAFALLDSATQDVLHVVLDATDPAE